MKSDKKTSKNKPIENIDKGLPDSELISKYESGKINMKKVLKKTLKKPKK